jgi:signal transduction histidine kinase
MSLLTVPLLRDAMDSIGQPEAREWPALPAATDQPAATIRRAATSRRPRGARLRGAGLLAVAAIGALFTELEVGVPSLRFGPQLPALGGELAILSAVVAGLVGMLSWGRYLRTRAATDLLIAAALAVLAASNLGFQAIPAAAHAVPGAFLAWASLTTRLLGILLLAAAALAPLGRVRTPARLNRQTLVTLVIGVVVALAAAAVLSAATSGAVDLARMPTFAVFSGPAAGAVGKLVGLALLIVAVGGFSVRRERRLDWFGVCVCWGVTLLAFAWMNYLLVPSLYSTRVYSADILHSMAYLMLGIGAVGEIRSNQANTARAALMDERARIARELHDGLAQELVYLLGQVRRLQRNDPSEEVSQMRDAVERALGESRAAISTFRAPLNEPLSKAVERVSRELSRRLGLAVEVTLDAEGEVSQEVRETIVRIVAEALTNAARHGDAEKATVELIRHDRLMVRISDSGIGFDTTRPERRSGSYGLLVMRERAEALGGVLHVHSTPGAGTVVELVLP